MVVALLSAVAVIFVLSLDVVRKIDQQSTASTDNVQWSIAQINVEYLQLLLAMERAIAGTETLEEVRQRFDVFYSRMITLQLSPVFAVLREDPDYTTSFGRIWDFLTRRVILIDGSDADLRAGLGEIAAELRDLRGDASVMGLTGIRVFASRTDAEREGIASTLLQVSVLTLGLILGMGILAATLARMNTAIKRQVLENQIQGERVKAVFSTSLDAVIVTDADGRILEFNAAAEAVFGYSAAEALGQDIAPLIIPPALREAHWRGMARYRQAGAKHVIGAGHLRMTAMRKGGETFPIEAAVSVNTGADGVIFISYLRDVSAQVAAEEELYRARDDALAGEKAKAELLAVMSHEMRTPLNGLLGTIELLQQTRLTAKQRQYHRIMESSGRLLLHHVNDVLDIARLDSGKAAITSQRFDLAPLLCDIVENLTPMALAGENRLRTSLPADGRTVIAGDPVRLRQILLNLVGNALKFTRNGEVRIDVARRDAAGQIDIRVADTGIGIRKEDQDRIFDDFVTLDASYTRSSSGTGLGLGIARRWARALGGDVSLESEPGVGSVFQVSLPLSGPAERPASGEAAEGGALPEPPVGRSLALLVVEDNPVNRLVVREMLESDGHAVAEAQDGQEGIRLAARHRWDAIFMDVSMPQKDGVEATIAIRKSGGASADSPIIALTAHALPGETDRFLAAGMQVVMTKPVSRDALRRVLRQVLGQRDERPESAGGRVHPAAPMEEPLIDQSRLADLIATLGKERAASLFQAFVDETDPVIAGWRGLDLVATPQGAAAMALQADAHRIAGSAALMGAARLRAHLAEAEAAGKAGDGMRLAEHLQQAADLWPETCSALLAQR